MKRFVKLHNNMVSNCVSIKEILSQKKKNIFKTINTFLKQSIVVVTLILLYV